MNTKVISSSSIYRILETVWALLILNFLVLISSLPIFTIGSSITAAYSVCFKLIETGDTKVIRNFYSGFKQSFIKASVAWGVLIGVLTFLAVDLYAISQHLVGNNWIIAGVMLVLLLTLFVSQFVFPYIARYEASGKTILTNIVKIICCHPFVSLTVVCISVLPIGLMIVSPLLFIFIVYISLFFLISFTIYLKALLIKSIFHRYEIQSEV